MIDRQTVSFDYEGGGGGGGVMMPEPSAALVFGVGLLITRGALRRRSA